MAVGDVVSDIQSIDSGGYLDIQPAAGVEWVIHNIYHASNVQLEFYDGTNSLIFDTDTGAGVYAKYAFHVNNTRRIRVKNTSASAQLIGYDGIVTRAV
ncbi:hypothetical protein G4O51_11925 [Candidatus Bathyarchaeota archaeon A05DMB-2]|nr:hypothetical protein [Candidatus Bathyarchaeota archaeon A05DMB-2]